MSIKKQTATTDGNVVIEGFQNPLDNYLSSLLGTEPERKRVRIDMIDPDPANRRYFRETGIPELAKQIALVGILQDIIIRPMPDGRYRLAAGERRWRAAQMAGLVEIDAKVCELSDEEARRVRFIENEARNNPHFIEQAELVGDLIMDYHSVEEVAGRLGKSKGFVYSRMKLALLIEQIRDICLADKFTIQEALEIALLSSESQTAFYERYCSGWRDNPKFRVYDLQNRLNEFKYRLKSAPFNVKAKTLLPDVGACTDCQFNTAVIQSLFPGSEGDTTCLKQECFHRKCDASFAQKFSKAISEIKPTALVFFGKPSQVLIDRISNFPEAASLQQHSYYEIRQCSEPVPPEAKDFPKFWEGQTEPATDEAAFAEANEKYQETLTTYQQKVQDGKIMIGLVVTEDKMEQLVFTTDFAKPAQTEKGVGHTAKEVEDHIKAGTVTIPMLKEQVQKSDARETRAKEIDREKVQVAVHEGFSKQLSNLPAPTGLTPADQATMRFLVYESMDYESREKTLKRLFPKKKTNDLKPEVIYERFLRIDDATFAGMIHLAVIDHKSAKYPSNPAAQFLYKTAESAGFDVAAIEKTQEGIARKRQRNYKKKVSGIKGMIKRMAA